MANHYYSVVTYLRYLYATFYLDQASADRSTYPVHEPLRFLLVFKCYGTQQRHVSGLFSLHVVNYLLVPFLCSHYFFLGGLSRIKQISISSTNLNDIYAMHQKGLAAYRFLT